MALKTKTHAQKYPIWSHPGVYVSLLVLFAASMAFFVWMRQSIRLDEAQSIWQTSRNLGGVMRVIARDVHVPLYFVGLHFWEVVFGTKEFSIRLFSLIFFLASIPAIFVLAREVYSERVAYLTAFITVISPFLNWYGSEARMYSLLFLCTILSHLYFLRLIRSQTASRWLMYALVTVLGLFTHLFFFFIVIAQAVFVVWRRDLFGRRSYKNFLAIGLLLAFLMCSWFGFRFLEGAGLTNPLLTRPTTVDFFNVFSNFFIGFQTDIVNTFYLSLWPLIVFIGFTFLARKRYNDPETSYFALASFLPIILAFLISATLRPIFLSRYLIVSLPSIYLLAMYFLSSYKKAIADVCITVLAAMMAVMLAYQIAEPFSPVKEDYRSASHYVEARATPADIFVVSAPFITYPVEYYYDGSARLVTFPRWDRYAKDAVPEAYSDDSLAAASADWAKVYKNVYLLLGYDQGYEEKIRLYMDKHYQRVALEKFSPDLTLYVYKLRYI